MVRRFFQGSGAHPMEHVQSVLIEMLANDRHSFDVATSALLDGADAATVGADLRMTDRKVNEGQRTIRRELMVHASVHGTSQVSAIMIYMSIVKDVERIGDYAKNVAEIHHQGGGSVPGDENGAELRAIRASVEETFGAVKDVFVSSDTQIAIGLIQKGRSVNRRCDALIKVVAASSYDAATTTSMVLGARYYKRIESHLLNVLSGVVMPLHKLDYYDEKSLDPDAAL